MKKIILIIVIILIISLALFLYFAKKNNPELSVLLLYNVNAGNILNPIQNAYNSILEEEGVNYTWANTIDILEIDPRKIFENHPAIIFPDKITQFLPDDYSGWVDEYITAGGEVLIVYESGTKYSNMCYRDQSVFALNIGADYMFYNYLGGRAFSKSSIQFLDKESADFFEIPYGKLSKDNKLTTYGYPELSYVVAEIEIIKEFPLSKCFAYSVFENERKVPNIILRSLGKGNLLFVNLPIGYLKAFASDDMLPRSILRTFLFKIAKIPHLSSAPYNKGGLVINWHLDSAVERKLIPQMINKGIIRKNLPSSFSITAGDFINNPGDDEGIDAAGRGKETVKKLMDYGTIGSQGGWAYNWFSKKIEDGEFSKEDIKKYIKKNNVALYKTVNYKIKEYAAPNGIHPQPLLTNVLAELGFTSYYYSGDAGSVPNRTFFRGEKISDEVIAFPIMPFRDVASFMEMSWKNISPEELKTFLFSILDSSTNHKTTRLLYSHFFDFIENDQYLKPFAEFMDEVDKRVESNELTVQPMTYFADFLKRFVKTKQKLIPIKDGLKIELVNDLGLKGITLAIPKADYKKNITTKFFVSEDNNYYYYVILEDINESILKFDLK